MESGEVAQGIGLRRVDWVRLLFDRGQVRAEAVGVGFRLPVTRPITLVTASRLIEAGTPCVRRHAPV
jgi:hypothetical protein